MAPVGVCAKRAAWKSSKPEDAESSRKQKRHPSVAGYNSVDWAAGTGKSGPSEYKNGAGRAAYMCTQTRQPSAWRTAPTFLGVVIGGHVLASCARGTDASDQAASAWPRRSGAGCVHTGGEPRACMLAMRRATRATAVGRWLAPADGASRSPDRPHPKSQ